MTITKKSTKNQLKETLNSEGMEIPEDPKMPKEVKEKLKKIKTKVDSFSNKVVKKFDQYILGVALLPPPKLDEGETVNKDAIYTLVVIDDSDSKRMTKQELKEKLTNIIEKTAKETDKDMETELILLSDLWQKCFDGKNDILQKIAMSAPIYDKGLLRTLKVTEVHKSMVIKKFEKYVVSYILGGSIYKGTAREESDIDIFIIVDDTDVKRMSRGELKDKLMAIMYGMAGEAGMITGIKNKLHLQVYILTDYWEALKESHPVMVDTLREGIPLYDRGMFMPWKQLLKMGKIRPSPEAIDLFMKTGDQALKRVKFKLKDMAMDDIFLAMLTPTQAALMMYGVQPQGPRETPDQLREIFVKEGLIEEKYVKILEHNLKVRKDIEHGHKKEATGAEVDKLLSDAEDYLKRIQKVFTEIETKKETESVNHISEAILNVTRDVLKVSGVQKVKDSDLIDFFTENLINTSKVGAKYLKLLKELMAVIEKPKDKVTKTEMAKFKKTAKDYIKYLVEFMQRTRSRELEKVKIRVKVGEKFGEIILANDLVFIVHEVDNDKKVSKSKFNDNGSLSNLEDSSYDEMDSALKNLEGISKLMLKPTFFESIKDIFGKDVEIFFNH